MKITTKIGDKLRLMIVGGLYEVIQIRGDSIWIKCISPKRDEYTLVYSVDQQTLNRHYEKQAI